MRTLLAFIALLAAVPQSHADYCAVWGTRFIERDWPQQSYRTCYCRRWVREEPTRVYGYERREERDDDRWRERHNCRDVRRVVGDQHLTVDGAKKAANDSWAGTVRFHLGEKFMELNNAARIVYTCSRSSIKEGGVTTLGQTLTRCEIEAQPCEAQKKPGEREDR